MNSRFVGILFVLCVGCAASKAVSKPQPTMAEPAGAPAADAKPKRVSLPYRFSRHGVAIQADSVESAEGQVLVNLTLEETRSMAVDLPASSLMRVLTSTGESLGYLNYSRAGQKHEEAAISLASQERVSVTLIFKSAAPGSAPGPLEVRFPTGKYWSSQAAE